MVKKLEKKRTIFSWLSQFMYVFIVVQLSSKSKSKFEHDIV